MIADIFSVDPATVRTWIKRGCPHSKKGRLFFLKAPEVATWKKEHVRPTAGRPVSPQSASLLVARARKEAALADLNELELAQKRGKLIDRDEEDARDARNALIVRDAFRNMPTTVAPSLIGRELAEIEATLARVIDEILTTISRGPTPQPA